MLTLFAYGMFAYVMGLIAGFLWGVYLTRKQLINQKAVTKYSEIK